MSIALQEGKYIAQVQTQPNWSLPDYTAFPFSDIQKQMDMNPVLGTCFANMTGLTIPAALRQQVNDCAANTTLCCYVSNDQVGAYH